MIILKYYDTIILRYYGTKPLLLPTHPDVAATGKLPFPLIDDITILDDWTAERTHVSLRINKHNTLGRLSDYTIDPKQKYTFKFIADEIPNVRALMFIHGKRYIAAKITATFTEQGMSQLLKLEAYKVLS